jgi:hypothetical protein
LVLVRVLGFGPVVKVNFGVRVRGLAVRGVRV